MNWNSLLLYKRQINETSKDTLDISYNSRDALEHWILERLIQVNMRSTCIETLLYILIFIKLRDKLIVR